MKRLALTIGLVLMFGLPAFAQTYKWIDQNGKVQYSDTPPPSNIKSDRLRIPAHAPDAPPPSAAKGAAKDAAKGGPKTTAEQEQAFRKRQLDSSKAEQEQEQKQAEATREAENCRRARAALTNLQIGGRQMRIDEKGERVFLDDAQIAQETARAQQEVAQACK